MKQTGIAVFDFFSGCGGTSSGFQKAGMKIAFALDKDADAIKTFKHNFPEAKVHIKEISDLKSKDILPLIRENRRLGYKILFCGCAPCQPFTKQKTTKTSTDTRIMLLAEFGRQVKKYKPDYVFIENVPGLRKAGTMRYGPFHAFKKILNSMKYKMDYDNIAAQDFGSTQVRRRFVFIASKKKIISLPLPSHGLTDSPYKLVKDAIADLPPIGHGEEHPDKIHFPNHRASALSPINYERIRHTASRGRRDWPQYLIPPCYKMKKDGTTHQGHSDCYSRLSWNAPAPGLTTRCISYSNGRYGHPEQNRAISAREAARIQGFTDNFIFLGSLISIARQIGNAVPVELAETFGRHILAHSTQNRKSRMSYG
ncbi:MAG: DNA cytosine methyltransferase [Victivallales bacterium]